MLDEMLPYVCCFFLEYLAFSIGYTQERGFLFSLFQFLIIFVVIYL